MSVFQMVAEPNLTITFLSAHDENLWCDLPITAMWTAC